MIEKNIREITNMNENEKTEIHNENNTEMTAGEILRNARTTGRRKREIPTIAKQLCIREEFLQALEDGDYKVIPEHVYILGFARNYAMELGLDPDEIVNKVKRELGLIVDEKKEEDDVVDTDDASDNSGWLQRMLGATVKFLRRHWLLASCVAVLVLAIIGGAIFWAVSGNNDIVPQEPVAAETIVDNETSELPFNVDVRERFGTDNAGTANVILQATGESWVKIEDARGNSVFSRVLVPGDVYYVPAGDGYTAVFGNAGGVDVWVNGKLAPKQGADHARVSDISLNPDDLIK